MNQKIKLLKVLRKRTRAGITQLEAAYSLGILRLSERIRELERDGHVIQKTWETKTNDSGYVVNYVRYRLEE